MQSDSKFVTHDDAWDLWTTSAQYKSTILFRKQKLTISIMMPSPLLLKTNSTSTEVNENE